MRNLGDMDLWNGRDREAILNTPRINFFAGA